MTQGDGLKVAMTGSSGFVGSILMRGLTAAGHRCTGFDRFGGPVYRLLATRHFQPLALEEFDSPKAKLILKLWDLQKRILSGLIRWKVLRPTDVNILDAQETWIERFRGCDAVVHLASIPHPDVPGMRPLDFELVNYWGAVNIFEAAVAAGVKRFVFASSGQVYDLNNYAGWREFPVREEVADTIQQTQRTHPYSSTKWRFERYLSERSRGEDVTSIALRLEFPGAFGGSANNLWTQTSVENLVQAFDRALRAKITAGGYKFNICNGEIPRQLGDVRALIPQHWPDATDRRTGNEALLDISAARRHLGYDPVDGGRYYMAETMF